MTPAEIAGLAYLAGLVLGLVYVGANDVKWGNGYGSFGPAWYVFGWPLAAPVVLGRQFRRRAERLRLAEQEKRKWLEAPLP